MKNLLVLLGLFIGLNSFAANGSGNVSSVTQIGGISTSDNIFIPNSNPDGYFTLYTSPDGGSAVGGNFYAFYKNGVAYQVTAGKTFKISKICGLTGNASANFQLVTATATFNNTSSLTGPVYMGGITAKYPIKLSTTANTYTCFSMTYDMAASTYAGVQLQDGAFYSIIVVGKEI